MIAPLCGGAVRAWLAHRSAQAGGPATRPAAIPAPAAGLPSCTAATVAALFAVGLVVAMLTPRTARSPTCTVAADRPSRSIRTPGRRPSDRARCEHQWGARGRVAVAPAVPARRAPH